MELCVLKFDGSQTASDNLKDAIDAQADRTPWLHDIGIIARPLIGRVRVSATFPDGQSKTFREGDLADAAEALGAYTGYYVSSLVGPLSSMFSTVNTALAAGQRGADLEARLFRMDEIKKALPRDSSALVMIADSNTIDSMVKMFTPYGAKVSRYDVEEELRKRLEALHRLAVQRVAQGVEAVSAQAPH
jgi:uncharacterized membrane protein